MANTSKLDFTLIEIVLEKSSCEKFKFTPGRVGSVKINQNKIIGTFSDDEKIDQFYLVLDTNMEGNVQEEKAFHMSCRIAGHFSIIGNKIDHEELKTVDQSAFLGSVVKLAVNSNRLSHR